MKITLVRFLKLYYNIPSSKSKYFRHKDFKYLLPNIKSIRCDDYSLLNEKVSIGEWLCIEDCSGLVMYYENPFYKEEMYCEEDTTINFEESDEFQNSPTYYRFQQYENSQYDYDNASDILFSIPRFTTEELSRMQKWELVELKEKLVRCNKRTMGSYYFMISLIKKELSKRRKEKTMIKK